MFKRLVNAVEVVALAAAAVFVVLLVAYRPSSPTTATPSTAAASSGEAIFRANCSRCHGSDGGGATAPKLAGGAVVARFPDAADQRAVIANGRGGMPAWAGRLTDDEIDAVVRYTREDL